MKTLYDIPNLEGVKVLLRVDFNVPVQHDKVVDDFRIRASLPTINFLKEKGAKVILLAHIESVDGKNISLEPVHEALGKLGVASLFIKDMKSAYHY